MLDQAAGQSSFVHDYLHVSWDGSEDQNDRLTNSVTGLTGNPVTDGITTVPLDISVNGGPNFSFMDHISPISGAHTAFIDDGTHTHPPVRRGPARGPPPR